MTHRLRAFEDTKRRHELERHCSCMLALVGRLILTVAATTEALDLEGSCMLQRHRCRGAGQAA